MTCIYLDYAATTPVDTRVLDAMLPCFTQHFGNAASTSHAPGRAAAEAVECARAQVADALAADPREIIWTSGATEATNLALQGIAASPAYARKARHIVTATTEHKATLDTCAHLETQGYEITRLPVGPGGALDLQQLEDALRDDTLLVTLMHANNETGVLHPIAEIGAICKAKGVLFHSDATQGFGKIPLDVNAVGIDLLSLSAHKIYGPKGAGALYIRRKNPRVRCAPIQHGGGHERGFRSGTLNVPGIVGLGAAAELALRERDAEAPRLRALRDHLESELQRRLPGVQINGDPAQRIGHISNLSFDGIDAERLMKNTPGLALSSSAACTSAARQPSYVLHAMGHPEPRITGSLRISLGRPTTAEEIDTAIDLLVQAIESDRSIASSGSTCEL